MNIRESLSMLKFLKANNSTGLRKYIIDKASDYNDFNINLHVKECNCEYCNNRREIVKLLKELNID